MTARSGARSTSSSGSCALATSSPSGTSFGTTERIQVHVGPVASTHPDPAARKRPLQPPPPPAKIRALLAKLAELPRDQPKREAVGNADLSEEVARLRRELAAARTAAPQIERYPFIPPQLTSDLEALERGLAVALAQVKELRRLGREFPSDRIEARPPDRVPNGPMAARRQTLATKAVQKVPEQLTRGARDILAVLAVAHPQPLSRLQLANRCIMTPKGSTLRTYLGHLLAGRLIERSAPDSFTLTDAGRAAAGGPVALDGRSLVERWRPKLTGKAKDMLDLFAREGRPLSRDEIGARLDIDPAGSTFRTYLGHLKTNGLVRKVGDSFAVAPDLAH